MVQSTSNIPAVSVVIFGPTNAGKSTLAGYLLVNKLKLDLEKTVANIRREYAGDYDPGQDYAYVVDEYMEEIKRRTPSSPLGTSKYLHQKIYLETIPVSSGEERRPINIVVIDVPGAHRYFRARMMGMYVGEIAIFMLEATALLKSTVNTDIVDNSQLTLLLESVMPLKAWLDRTDGASTIVVFSKFDKVSGNAHAKFHECIEVLQSKVGSDAENIDFIATEIDVESRRSKGVLSRNGFEFVDLTVEQAIQKKAAEILTKRYKALSANEPLVMVPQELQTAHGAGTVLQGKIITGTIKAGTELQIAAPPSPRSRPQVLSVSSIRNIAKADVPEAHEGDIVTLAFKGNPLGEHKDLPLDGRVLMSAGQPADIGTEILVEVPKERLETPLRTGQRVQLAWLGRLISCEVVVASEEGLVWSVVLQQVNLGQVALPTSLKESPSGLRTFLRRPTGSGSDLLGATIRSVGHVKELTFSLSASEGSATIGQNLHVDEDGNAHLVAPTDITVCDLLRIHGLLEIVRDIKTVEVSWQN